MTLLNKSGGRSAAIWTGIPSVGQRIGQWVDDTPSGLWNLNKTPDGYWQLQSAGDPTLYLTGTSPGAPLTLQNATSDGSQDWQLIPEA